MNIKKYLLRPQNISNNINKSDLIISTLSLIIFIILSYFVATDKLRELDKNLLLNIREILPSWFMYIAKVSYFLGEAEVTVFFVIFCLAILVWKKYWEEAQVVALSCLSVLILVDQILKPFFAIRRPLGRLVPAITGYTYPSGHVAGNLLFYFLVAYIASQYFPQLKVYFYSLATFLIILMSISITYLRVHWISDIFASYCLGYILFILSILLLNSSVGDRYHKNFDDKN